MDPAPYYTRQTLADECRVSLRTISHHLKAGTCRINKAAEKIPGVGVRINGPLAKKFIEIMTAKPKPNQSNEPTNPKCGNPLPLTEGNEADSAPSPEALRVLPPISPDSGTTGSGLSHPD